MFKMSLIKAIRGLLSCFSTPVSEIPLTYRSELIDEAYEDSVLGLVLGEEIYTAWQAAWRKPCLLHSLRIHMTAHLTTGHCTPLIKI